MEINEILELFEAMARLLAKVGELNPTYPKIRSQFDFIVLLMVVANTETNDEVRQWCFEQIERFKSEVLAR